MTLSAPQLALWRTARHSVFFDIYVHPPALVFQARVNMVSATYPLTQLTFDTVTTGAFGDIEAEMLVCIGSSAGADDYGRQRVRPHYPSRGVSTSSTINVGRSSKGTHDGELTATDNAYISVYDLRGIWATPPRIDTTVDPDNPVTYKDGAVAFDDTYCFEPVCIMGGDRLEIVAGALDTFTFAYDWSDSYVTHPDAGSITDYDADFGGLDTSTSGSGTVELPVGAHRIRLTITDDLGNVMTSWRLWVVANKGHADLLAGFQVRRHSERADGQEFQLRLSKPLSYITYPDGTEVLVRQHERYDTTVESIGILENHENMVLSAWIDSESNEGAASAAGFLGRTMLTLADVAGRLKELPGFPLVVERKAAPTRWEHMQEANIDLYHYHLLRWHSNALSRVDFQWSGTGSNYPFQTLGSDGQSLWEQVDRRCQAIAHNLTCDRHNRLIVLGDPNLLPSATQAALVLAQYGQIVPVTRASTVIASVLESDWKNYSFDYARPPRLHWNWGEAIVAAAVDADSGRDIQTVFCVAPGEAPGQGVSEARSGEQLVAPSVHQYELNVREGNRYTARMNGRMGYLAADLRPGDAGLSPARKLWVRFTISSDTAAPRGRTVSAERFLPIELTHTYDHAKGTRKTRITLEREVEGTLAATYIPPDDTDFPNDGQPPAYPFPPTTPTNPVLLGSGRYIVIGYDGDLYWTATGNSASPVWYKVTLGLTGLPLDFIADPFSPAYLLGPGTPTSPNELWLRVATETHVYKLAFNTYAWSITATDQKTLPSAGIGLRRIEMERGVKNFAIVGSVYAGSFKTCATTDGATWGAEVAVSSVTPGAYGTPLLYPSPRVAGKVLTSESVNGGAYAGKVSTNYGASYSTIVNPLIGDSDGEAAYGGHVPFHNNAAETLVYAGWQSGTESDTWHRIYKINGASRTDISPTFSGSRAGAETWRGIDTAPNNRLKLVAVLRNGVDNASSGSDVLRVGYCLDGGVAGGGSWNFIAALDGTPAAAYTGVRVLGDGSGFLAFGHGGRLALCDFAGNYRSIAGNLSSLGCGLILNVVGW